MTDHKRVRSAHCAKHSTALSPTQRNPIRITCNIHYAMTVPSGMAASALRLRFLKNSAKIQQCFTIATKKKPLLSGKLLDLRGLCLHPQASPLHFDVGWIQLDQHCIPAVLLRNHGGRPSAAKWIKDSSALRAAGQDAWLDQLRWKRGEMCAFKWAGCYGPDGAAVAAIFGDTGNRAPDISPNRSSIYRPPR
jgi:hypothetical protein